MKCGCGNVKEGADYTLDQCRRCWLGLHVKEYAEKWGLPKPKNPMKIGGRTKKTARSRLCVFLGKRVEFRTGCGGAKCRHECEQGLPAVPNGYCQSCTKYVADE